MWSRSAALKGAKLGGRAVRNKSLMKYYAAPKKCLFCGVIMHVPYNKPANWALKKKFCDHSCAVKYNNRKRYGEPVMQTCPACGKTFEAWRNKIFCSRKCFVGFGAMTLQRKWLCGEALGNTQLGAFRSFVRPYMLKKHKHKCSKCGWNEINPVTGVSPLAIHHIDGDVFNARPENLELLCPNCHSLTPNYKNLNYGYGRGARSRRKADGEVAQRIGI